MAPKKQDPKKPITEPPATESEGTHDTLSNISGSSYEDDVENDPDYVPGNSEYTDTDTDTDDRSEEDSDEEDKDSEEDGKEDGIPEDLLQKLTPLLMGFGSPFQMPMMLVIQGNNTQEEDDNDEDYEDDDDDGDNEEDDGCEHCDGHEAKGVRNKLKDPTPRPMRKRKRSLDDIKKILREYNKEERTYIDNLPQDEKDRVLQAEMRIRNLQKAQNALPMRFKILDSPMDDGAKRIILAKLEQFQMMHEGSGEYFKLRNWLNAANRLPLGRFKELPIQADPNNPDDLTKVSDYLSGIKKMLDETVYGHRDAKEQVLRILAQWVSNPGSTGHCIGIQGPPGAGKTSLVKDGICRALGLPFALISLGCYGSDGAGLTGHHVTYEGSTYGKISECLIKAQHMNPILYFDELDKISATPKGEEVASVLIHLTDSTQNDHFSDNYFSEIPLDLSKCLIIFSYNDESLVNPILKDRMITIHVSGYTKKEKLEIAKGYLVPRILATYNLKPNDIVFDDTILEEIIERVAPEEGVRNLKRGIDAIISWINMRRYVPNMAPDGDGAGTSANNEPIKIELPVKITGQLVKKYLKSSSEGNLSKYLLSTMYT